MKNSPRSLPVLLSVITTTAICGLLVWMASTAVVPALALWIVGSLLLGGVLAVLLQYLKNLSIQDISKLDVATSTVADTANVISRQTSRMAIGSAEVSFLSDLLHRSVDENLHNANDISAAAEELSQTTVAIAQQAQVMSSQYEQAASATHQGQACVQNNADQVGLLNQEVEAASTSLNKLREQADAIQKITEVIENIAEHINLLALNAAIEAARAGEQGRGFAVVADEVRNLAQKTAHATDDIAAMLTEVRRETGASSEIMAKVNERCGRVVNGVQELGVSFADIQGAIDATASSLTTIDRSLQEHTSSVAHIAHAIERVRMALGDSSQATGNISSQAAKLSNNAEIIYRELGKWDTGTFDQTVLREAQQAASAIGQLLEKAVADNVLSNADLFSQDYQPIPNTKPQKYHTTYDRFTDQAFPAIQEPILQRHDRIVYAGAVDIKGYFPTHNKRFDHPLTGNYDTDLVKSRSKRIFNDATGQRCGSHTESFLLQTYKRDTGEVMHDLSVPIYVNGKHWGGFRIGFAAE